MSSLKTLDNYTSFSVKGRGRKPKLNDEQCRQINGWAKKYPKNRKKIVALVIEEYGLSVNKRTIKFDERGFFLEPYVPYARQEKGETIEVEPSLGQRLSVLGFQSLQRELVAYTTEGIVDSDFVIACFDEFIKELRGKTVVSMDNSTFHTSEAFEMKIPEWQSKGLEIFYLPKYSPQLNLIEILWRFEMVIRGYGTEYEINFG